ncbi:hypothetical protein D9757_006561 [Collybiopsis confluens]|uniref:Reverse transcriptase domain-containing protein n=1 Tax=Collybiopsis confluens TaxID=2823264 RepID=A0A8H5HQE9_9AGAR|nr:hypothetical protein D9757_006561 [Collybiopsis confluens]
MSETNTNGATGSSGATPWTFTHDQLQAFASLVLASHIQATGASAAATTVAPTPAPPPFTSTAQPLSTKSLAKGSGSLKDFSTLDALGVPLNHYFDVLITYARFSGSSDAGCALASGAVRYLASLLEMAKKYQWASVLQYHVDYMNIRRYEMKEGNYLGWGPIDGPLYAIVAANPKPVSPAFSSAAKSKAAKDFAQQPCFKWNKGECSEPCPDNRLHVCRDCLLKDHKRNDSACKKARHRRSRHRLARRGHNLPPHDLFTTFSSSAAFCNDFPVLSSPPARPNSDPRCNSIPFGGFSTPLSPVSSSLNYGAWDFYLKDYPDRSFVSSLLHIIRFGANIGFLSPENSQSCKNLLSAHEHPEFVDTSLADMVAKGHLAGPFDSPPLANFRCSPVGVVSKKHNSSKLRLINHLSWPHGSSVNDGIPDSEASISYDMFEKAVADLVISGSGSLLAKLDLKDAFRHIPLRADLRHLFGISWASKFYYSLVLTFGLKNAPYIFNLFAEALHWIVQRHIPARLRHYLDDFLLIFPPDFDPSRADASVEWVMSLGANLGLVFQPSKTIWPSQVIEFLGLILDSVHMEARLPSDKLGILRMLLATWASKSTCTLRDAQQLSGFLQFCSQVIPHSRIFLRRLFDFEATFKNPFSRRRIPAGVRSDLVWWQVFSSHWNGVRILSPSASVLVWTDASGVKGIGGVIRDAWFSTRVPRRFRKRDIQFKELYAVLHAILCWGNRWSGQHVVFYGDNQAVVQWLVSGTCGSPLAMPVLRLISMLAASLLQPPLRAGTTSSSGVLLDSVPPEWYQTHSYLSPRVAFYLFHGIASSTRKAYSSGQRSYIDFIRTRPALCSAPGQYLPATTSGILEWVASLGDRALQPKTIKSYLSSVRSLHVDAGLTFDACESPTVQRLIRGIKRYYGEKTRSPKLPITAAIMAKLASSNGALLGWDQANFNAAYKLAWSGFLRCGEFTLGEREVFNPAVHLTRDSVQFLPSFDNPSHIRLTLPESKTDPFRKGVSILIAAVPHSPFCAVTALKHLFATHPLPSGSPLFCTTVGLPMTRSFFISMLKSHLEAAGIPSVGYSGHSFRRGAATSAAAAGYSDYEIQLLGRWRSDAYKLYIDVPVDRVLHLSARLHVAAAAPAQLPEPLALHFAPGVVA